MTVEKEKFSPRRAALDGFKRVLHIPVVSNVIGMDRNGPGAVVNICMALTIKSPRCDAPNQE